MDTRFNSLDNTQPLLQNKTPNVPTSAFNESYMKHMNGIIGAIMPFDVRHLLPGQRENITYNVMCLTRNPLVRRLLSGMRIYVHTYVMRNSDLWEGWNNFVDKGRSGTMDLEIPTIDFEVKNGKGVTFNTNSVFSPSSFLGIPTSYYDSSSPLNGVYPVDVSKTKVTGNVTGVSALDFVMYERICRENFYNSNLLQDNKKLYPDNNDHVILPYNCSRVVGDDTINTVNCLDYDNPYVDSIVGDDFSDIAVPKNETSEPVLLNILHYRQFKGDYFTSASPFADIIRGNAPSINLTEVNLDWSDVFGEPLDVTSSGSSATSTNDLKGTPLALSINSDGKVVSYKSYFRTNNNSQIFPTSSSDYGARGPGFYKDSDELLKGAFGRLKASANANVTLNQLRQLNAYTLFAERNARTDGSYNQMVNAQFGRNPNCHEHDPKYIGGFYQDIVFNEVVQTGATSGDDYLGKRISNGISANGGSIGTYVAQDHETLMSVMTIVPDTFYTQGIDREFTRIKQSDLYFPCFNGLAPQAILNKELYFKGDSTVDDDVFAYTERFSDYKSKRNKIVGLGSLGHGLADFDSSAIMARYFDDTPQFNNKFVTMSPDNIDMSVFSVTDEPPFDITIACICDSVKPMPYINTPEGIL